MKSKSSPNAITRGTPYFKRRKIFTGETGNDSWKYDTAGSRFSVSFSSLPSFSFILCHWSKQEASGRSSNRPVRCSSVGVETFELGKGIYSIALQGGEKKLIHAFATLSRDWKKRFNVSRSHVSREKTRKDKKKKKKKVSLRCNSTRLRSFLNFSPHHGGRAL